VTDLASTDFARLKEGQGVLLDGSFLATGHALVYLDGQPAAKARRQGRQIVLDEWFGKGATLLPAAWNKQMHAEGDVRLTFEFGRATMMEDVFGRVASTTGIELPVRTDADVDIFADNRLVGQGQIIQIGAEPGIRVTRLN
jgi:hypothetical protein